MNINEVTCFILLPCPEQELIWNNVNYNHSSRPMIIILAYTFLVQDIIIRTNESALVEAKGLPPVCHFVASVVHGVGRKSVWKLAPRNPHRLIYYQGHPSEAGLERLCDKTQLSTKCKKIYSLLHLTLIFVLVFLHCCYNIMLVRCSIFSLQRPKMEISQVLMSCIFGSWYSREHKVPPVKTTPGYAHNCKSLVKYVSLGDNV